MNHVVKAGIELYFFY